MPGQPSIRVVHVVLSLAIGGLEAVVVHLASRASNSVRPTVICLESLGPLAGQLTDRGIAVECIGTPSTPPLQMIRALRRRLRELAPDVLHTHNEKAHIHGTLATIGVGSAPIVHSRHGRGQADTTLSRLAQRVAIQRTKYLVCVSADATEVARQEGATPAQLRVVLNAIDVQSFDATRAEAEVGGWNAVTVARLAPVKDLETMLEAARIIRADHPSFRLHVVGDGESRPGLEKRASELGFQDAITFHGAKTDPRPYLASANVFLQSSLSEGVSLTLLEAMAGGLPIVATDVGGNPEVVDEGQTGYLVKPRDPRALAERVIRILQDPTEAARMSRAARLRAEQRFDVPRMVAEYETLYRQALA